VHKICHDVAPEPPVNDKIHIEGLPGDIDVDLKGMMPLDESYVTSAAPTVNIIPAVVEAQPGFRQAMDLPVVVPIR
jgi:4-hydroxy-tetrahydrodipicolinate reductase